MPWVLLVVAAERALRCRGEAPRAAHVRLLHVQAPPLPRLRAGACAVPFAFDASSVDLTCAVCLAQLSVNLYDLIKQNHFRGNATRCMHCQLAHHSLLANLFVIGPCLHRPVVPPDPHVPGAAGRHAVRAQAGARGALRPQTREHPAVQVRPRLIALPFATASPEPVHPSSHRLRSSSEAQLLPLGSSPLTMRDAHRAG